MARPLSAARRLAVEREPRVTAAGIPNATGGPGATILFDPYLGCAPHKYKLEVSGIGLDFAPVWYPAKIGRWHSSFRGIEKPDGYHPVTYDDGGKLLVHESSFRVVDNRALR
jgi:hypothetical protein